MKTDISMLSSQSNQTSINYEYLQKLQNDMAKIKEEGIKVLEENNKLF